MTTDQIIRSSVQAEYKAYCEQRDYSRLPKGHPVYMAKGVENLFGRIEFASAGATRKR